MYKHKVLLFGFVTLLLSGCGNVGESTSLIKNDEIIIHVKDYLKDYEIEDSADEASTFIPDHDGYHSLHLSKKEAKKNIIFSYPIRYDRKEVNKLALPEKAGEYYLVESKDVDGEIKGKFVDEKPVLSSDETIFFELKDKLLSYINYDGNISITNNIDEIHFDKHADILIKDKTERSKTIISKEGEIRQYQDDKLSYRLDKDSSTWYKVDYEDKKKSKTSFAQSRDIQNKLFLNDYTKIALFNDGKDLNDYLSYKMEMQRYYFEGADIKMNQVDSRYSLLKGENDSGTTYSLTYTFKNIINYTNSKTSLRESKTLLDESTTRFEFDKEDKLTKIVSNYERDYQIDSCIELSDDVTPTTRDLKIETITNKNEYVISYLDDLEVLPPVGEYTTKENEEAYTRYIPVYHGDDYLFEEVFTLDQTYPKNKVLNNGLTLTYYLDKEFTKPLEDTTSFDSFDKLYAKANTASKEDHFVIKQYRYNDDKFLLFDELYRIQPQSVSLDSLKEESLKSLIAESKAYSINGKKDYQDMKIDDAEEYIIKYVIEHPRYYFRYESFRF